MNLQLCSLRTQNSKHLKTNVFHSYFKKVPQSCFQPARGVGRCQSNTVCTRPHRAERSNQLSDNTCVGVQRLKTSCSSHKNLISSCKCSPLCLFKSTEVSNIKFINCGSLFCNSSNLHLFSFKQWSMQQM